MDHRTELDMAQAHVRRAQANIARQRDIIDESARAGQPTAVAERLLAAYEKVLELGQQHVARLMSAPD